MGTADNYLMKLRGLFNKSSNCLPEYESYKWQVCVCCDT
jgi:hypothetical protein